MNQSRGEGWKKKKKNVISQLDANSTLAALLPSWNTV